MDRVNEMRDSGIIMEPKLNFNSHREYVKKEADGKLAIVKRECFKALNLDNAKLLYGSLARSHLEFGSVIWSPYQPTHKKFVGSTQ